MRWLDWTRKKWDEAWAPHINVESIGGKHNDKIVWGDISQECDCPHCNLKVVSRTMQKASVKSYLIALALLLSARWVGLVLLPFLWPVLRSTEHYCSACSKLIATRSRLSLPEIRRDIVTLRAGNCAIVLSRRYCVAVLIIICCIIFFYAHRLYQARNGNDMNVKGPAIDNTWDDFVRDCGMKSQLGNPIKAVRMFDSVYKNKTIRWTGRISSIQEGIMQRSAFAINMFRSHNLGLAMDLILVFDKALYEMVEDFHVGDLIEFEATLISFGKRGQPHLAVMWDCKLVEPHVPNSNEDRMSLLGSVLSLFVNNSPENATLVLRGSDDDEKTFHFFEPSDDDPGDD